MNSLYCPHCGDRHLVLELDPAFVVDPVVVHCRTCGFRIYGDEAVRALVERQRTGLVCSTQPPASDPQDAVAGGDGDDPPARAAKRRGRHEYPCALCGQAVHRRPWDLRTTPSGLFFCSREHMYEHRRRYFAGRDEGAESPAADSAGGAWGRPLEDGEVRARRRRAPPRRDAHRRGAQPVSCALCGERVWRRPWDLRDSKSGLFFCRREHRTAYERRAREYDRHMRARKETTGRREGRRDDAAPGPGQAS
ncbi:hypothetical protein L6R50_25375 [Myxococcota bacterium]|nr:hypothetical protein [Myxococcota bacterium]